MSDPKDEVDPRARRSQRLAADLFLDEDEGGGTVPDRPPHAANNEPPTVPIDLSGFQEMPLPLPEIAPAPLAFPPKESSANRMSASPPPTSGSYSFPGKEISGRHSGIRTIPAAQVPQPPRSNDPAVSGSRPLDPALQQRIRELQPTQPMQTNLPPVQPIQPAPMPPPLGGKQPLPMWSPQPQPASTGPSLALPLPAPAAAPAQPVFASLLPQESSQRPAAQQLARDPSAFESSPSQRSTAQQSVTEPQPQRTAAQHAREPFEPHAPQRAPAQPAREPFEAPQAQRPGQHGREPLELRSPLHHAREPQAREAALNPYAPRAIAVTLPCSVLVVDDDTKAGALVASRLLEHGYSVRVVKWSEARAAAGEARYDAIVAEIGADEARVDAGKSRVEGLKSAGVPMVLTSPAVFRVELLRDLPEVAAALTKPFFVEVLISTVESSRTRIAVFEAPKPRDVTEPARGARDQQRDREREAQPPPASLEPLTDTVGERRAAERYELDVNVVRALINGGPEQQAVRGRVRNISTAGGVLLDTASRLNAKAAVTAELALYDGRVMLFNGRVVRQAKQELALKLETDENQRAFIQKFVEDARAQDGRALQPVRINVKDESAAALDDVALMKRWLEVSDQIEDDEVQQRFIQDCLRAERIEFAIARYRDLKNTRPDDERVGKYLLQLGTILSFKALSKKDLTIEKQKLPASLKMVIGFFVIAGIALLLILIKALR